MSIIRKVGKRISRSFLVFSAIWIVAIVMIQIAAPNPIVEKMPETCPENSGNCVRVDFVGTSYRYNNLESPVISASVSEVNEVISNWFSNEKDGKILFSKYNENEKSYFSHIKDSTEFLFFPDDIFVTAGCLEGSNLTAVTLQSQSRLGKGDLGVNFERLSELILYLDQYSWSGTNCDSDN